MEHDVVAAVGSRLPSAGFDGFGVLDAQGKTRFESVKFVAQPELEAPAAAAGAALVWHQRMLLRTRIPILDDG